MKDALKRFLCKIGIHRPLVVQEHLFNDFVTNESVMRATCPCGREWMTDGGPWIGFKVERKGK